MNRTLDMIEDIKYEISEMRKELNIKKRIFDAEQAKERELLNLMERWSVGIENQLKREFEEESKDA